MHIGKKPKRIVDKTQLDKIRQRNKDRSKAMERYITKHLNGRRTPMSGAGMIKGDGIVYLPNDSGIAVIECKLTGVVNKKGPAIAFQVEWLEKLQSDVNAMRSLGAKFGILIVKFMYVREMYAFVRIEDIPVIEKYTETIVHVTQDTFSAGGIKPWKIRQVQQELFHSNLHNQFITPNGVYAVLSFNYIKGWFRKDTTEDVSEDLQGI